MKLLEETSKYFEKNIPDTEILWKENMNILAMFYNNEKKSDLAYTYIEKVINYYHEANFGPIGPRNKTICDLTNENLAKSAAATLLMEKVSTHTKYLPQKAMDTIKELIVSLATKYNFNGVRLVEHYMQECIESYKSNVVWEEGNEGTMLDFNLLNRFRKKSAHLNKANLKFH